MEEVILVIHLILALSIIGLVLLQRSEGGALGIGGGPGGLSTPHGAKTALSRMTAICAAGFFCTSLILGVLAGTHSRSGSILDALEQTPPPVIEQEAAPAAEEQPAAETEEAPSAPKAE